MYLLVEFAVIPRNLDLTFKYFAESNLLKQFIFSKMLASAGFVLMKARFLINSF